MSIIINNKNMPRNCYDCGLTDTSFIHCSAHQMFPLLEDDCERRRPKWCPLEEDNSPKWIPCKVRFPRSRELVLISRYKVYGIDFGYYDRELNMWFDMYDIAVNPQDVNAWMPILEPYKEERS